MKRKTIIRTIVDLVLVAALILGAAYQMGLLTGFPKGNDIYAYLTKVRLIDTYFPHINWNPFWDSGTPFSIWSYPPLPMTFTAFFFVKLLGQTPEKALILMGAMSFVFLGWGLYGLVKEATGKRLAGLLTVVLFASSPASWNWWVLANCVRVFGLGFFGLSLWAMVGYFKRYLLGKESQGWFWLALVLTSLAVSSHLLIGSLTILFGLVLVFFAVPSLGEKLRHWGVFIGLPLLAAAYYYLPLFFTGKAGGRFIGINPGYPIPAANWFWPVTAQEDYSLSPALSLGFLISFVLIILFSLFRKRERSQFKKAILWSFSLFILGNIFYNAVGHLPFYPETFYIVGFPPIGAFALNSLAWAIGAGIFIGILFSEICPRAKIANGLILILIFAGGMNLCLGFDSIRVTVRDLSTYGGIQDLSQQVVKLENPKEFNYRFGTDSGLVADWFTYHYDMPQTRDYFAQGIPHINWQNWMETAVWAWEGNYTETNFLLDWYAIKDIFVTEPHYNVEKFLNQPKYYSVASAQKFTKPAADLVQFRYREAKPLLAPSNASPILVIGQKGEYEVFLKTLAQIDSGPQKVIPVFINRPVDSFSLEELKKFKLVALYNYDYKSQSKFDQLLKDYLNSGGQLYIESFQGRERQASSLPSVFPVSQTQKADVNFNWNFLPADNYFLKGLSLADFGEASYRGTPWHVSLAPQGALKSGAEAILANAQGILMASQEIGSGRIIWSGINFPFHLIDSKNQEEFKLWRRLFTWFGLDQDAEVTLGQMEFIHPERRILTVNQPARGILFKETNFMDWQAEINGQEQPIYFAGPGFMYLFLEKGISYPAKATFSYHLSWLEKISFLTAFLAWVYLFLLGLEAWTGKTIISSLLKPFGGKKDFSLAKKIAGWWDKEET